MRTRRVSDDLLIHEHAHVLGVAEPQEVRTFVTEGLAARGSPELRATVSDDWADEAVDVALALLVRADESPERVTLGTSLRFADPALARGATLGVTWARPQPVDGIPGSAAALVSVLLHEEELEIAATGLAARVLGLLARAARWFPYPPIWEVRDAPVLSLADQATSVLEQAPLPRVTVGDTRVTREGDRVTLSLPGGAEAGARRLWQDMPDLSGFVIGAHLAPDADGQYVFVPGATGLHATARGSERPARIGHNYIALIESDQTLMGVQEDGVGVLLAPDRFAELREALEGGAAAEIGFDDGAVLAIEFRR